MLVRRRFLRLASAAAALPAISQIARAQTYPTRPVHLIVGFAAGGATDVVARVFGQWLSEKLGQTVVIENRPGAATNIATEAVVNAAPDGYTVLLAGVNHAIGASVHKNLSFNFIRDIEPVAGLMRVPNIMEVPPSLPVRTVPEFIAYAKANPGKLSYASSGAGTSVQMSAELFKMLANVDLVHVPYSRGLGSGGYTDLMAGTVHVLFDNLPGSIEFVRSGKLRALAVTTAARSQALPDVPTVGEFVPGYEASAWYGLGAPKHTPTEIIDRLNRAVNATLADPKVQLWLAEMGGMPLIGSPAEFRKLIVDETDKWALVVKSTGAKPD
jgi:tripartite-type tricarboxylate transporter receptor subunit TctC